MWTTIEEAYDAHQALIFQLTGQVNNIFHAAQGTGVFRIPDMVSGNDGDPRHSDVGFAGTPNYFTGNMFVYPGISIGGVSYGVGGMNAGVLQWGASYTDGKFYAGAGAVVLDANGERIIVSTSETQLRALTFTNAANTIEYGGVYSYLASNILTMRFKAKATTGNDSLSALVAEAPSGRQARWLLSANDGVATADFEVRTTNGNSEMLTTNIDAINFYTNAGGQFYVGAGGALSLSGGTVASVTASAGTLTLAAVGATSDIQLNVGRNIGLNAPTYVTGLLSVSSTITASNFSGSSSGTNTGDVTLAGTPNYITIAGQVITRALIDLTTHVTGGLPLANMANVATSTVFYRKTAGTGVPEVQTLSTLLTDLGALGGTFQPLDSDLTTIAGLTATTDSFMQSKGSAWAARTIAQVKTDLGLTGTNSGDQTITLTGDVTGSGTGSFAATIASAAVTLAKMANLATATVIGRNTAGTGVPEALTTLPTGVMPAHTGDVTSSAGSNATTIAVGVVTLAKMANMATASVIYRKTAGSGAPEVNTLATLLTDMVVPSVMGCNMGGATVALSTTVYIGPYMSAAVTTTGASNLPISSAGTIKNLHVRTNSAQTGTGSLVFTVYKNNAAQTLVATVAAGAAATNDQADTTNSFTVAAGDRITVEIKNNGTAVSAQITGISFQFSPA